MTESTALNGSKDLVSNGNKPDKKPKKARYLPGLPIASSAKDTNKGVIEVAINRSPAEFSALDLYELFSTVEDGNDVMIKVTCSKAARLLDGKPFLTGGGRVYRVNYLNFKPISNSENSKSA
ncbi:MAG: hypothetical protein KME29_03800 [Calothrix sp. FI2-JRJ7]|jgi:hypothetical protein|nr:hypothetical protein [Calothrix sp. FI2-JRJ7]MBW4598744.1 hypothetical protein [Calothrix sp. FI2-JRJ7]